MKVSTRKFGLLIAVLVFGSFAVVSPVQGQCDIQDPDPDCPQRPVSVLRDRLFTNPNSALFACAPDDDFCVGLLLSNQDGVDSQAQFVEHQPQGLVGSHGYLHVVDAPGVICACPGGPDQSTCARLCLVGFILKNPHESERANCVDCSRLMINIRAKEDVAVDHDDDPETPPVIESLAYIGVGQSALIKAVDNSGDSCSATLVLDEIIPPFDFSFTLEVNSHGSVTDGCL